MILKLEDIFYRYDKRRPYILNGISCEFERGKLYAVTGGSGSGKTTLISIIAALARPSSGKILYDGIDTGEINEDRYRAKYVSTIFQSYNLLYNYTAVENIAMALHISGYTGDFAERADALLQEVGIPAEKRKYVVQNLSGGEQQRIAIARALAADSGVVLDPAPGADSDSAQAGHQHQRHQAHLQRFRLRNRPMDNRNQKRSAARISFWRVYHRTRQEVQCFLPNNLLLLSRWCMVQCPYSNMSYIGIVCK